MLGEDTFYHGSIIDILVKVLLIHQDKVEVVAVAGDNTVILAKREALHYLIDNGR